MGRWWQDKCNNMRTVWITAEPELGWNNFFYNPRMVGGIRHCSVYLYQCASQHVLCYVQFLPATKRAMFMELWPLNAFFLYFCDGAIGEWWPNLAASGKIIKIRASRNKKVKILSCQWFDWHFCSGVWISRIESVIPFIAFISDSFPCISGTINNNDFMK